MSMINVIGMPGLYQNWTVSCLDLASKYIVDSESNFLTQSDCVNLKFKMVDTTPADGLNVNLYVADKNFVWYLYNFLEKTDGVGIHVDNLVNDLFSKSPGTVAFDYMLKHFIDSYKITSDTSLDYCTNAIIEYFYFALNSNYQFKTIAKSTLSNAINIEYDDFSNANKLIKLLESVPNFSEPHFLKRYQSLVDRNERYLTKKINFVKKLNAKAPLDILEMAYVGVLLEEITQAKLDWFNPTVRTTLLDKHYQSVCDLAIITVK